MLSRLQVRNFVLIDSLEIDFPEGLIIITGQTGAGKSILLGALPKWIFLVPFVAEKVVLFVKGQAGSKYLDAAW